MSSGDLQDDPTIRDQCKLLRRIPPKVNLNLVWDDNLNRWRPTSASFDNHRDSSHNMSIVLGDDLDAAERDVTSVLEGHPGFLLAAITAKVARDNHQSVARDPLPQEPAHGLVVGRKSKGIKSKLAKAAEWVIPPDVSHLE